MGKLTPEVIKEYIENFGSECPHCNSEDIEGGSWDFGSGEFWQNVVCHSCKKEWTDTYTLSGITEMMEE